MNAIKIFNLCKQYDTAEYALFDLNLTIKKGSIFGLLGPNGAGKTTTVRLLNGTLYPTKGKGTVLNNPLGHEMIRKLTATLSENAHMYENLTVRENLLFFAQLYGVTKATIKKQISQIAISMEISTLLDKKLGCLSTGQKKRAALARTLLHSPKLIFLDEPTSGLDPEGSYKILNLFKELVHTEDTTLFLCTHNLDLAQEVCDCVGFLEKGRLIESGYITDLQNRANRKKQLQVLTKDKRLHFSIEDHSQINSIIKECLTQGEQIHEVILQKNKLKDIYFQHLGKRTKKI